MSNAQETGTKRKIKLTYVISALVISCLMLGTAFGMMISATTPTGFPTVIEPGSMVSGYSYIIFQDDLNTTYYAKNGFTGSIDFQSNDAGAVIQEAIDAVRANQSFDGGDGGTIILDRGTWWLTVPLNLSQSSINFRGSGFRETTIDFLTNGFIVNEIIDPWIGQWYSLSNLYIRGHGIGTGINMSMTRAYTIENVYVLDFDVGIYMNGCLGSIFTKVITAGCDYGLVLDLLDGVTFTNNDNSFYGCQFSANREIGLTLRNVTWNNAFYSCAMETNVQYEVLLETGMYSWQSPMNNVFYTCWFEGIAPTAIKFDKSPSASVYPMANSFIGCTFVYQSEPNIALDIAGSNNTVSGCGFYDSTNITVSGDSNVFIGNYEKMIGSIIVTDTGVDNYWRGNAFYITVNSGVATITGTVNSVTVDHDLSATPTVILITVNNTGAGNCSVSTITSTQFIISFANQPGTSEWEFYWYAEV